jgi:TolB-like protein
MSLFDEVRRRNVHRVALAYVAGAWLVIQVAETLSPVFGFEQQALRPVVFLLVIGLVPALILSWKFEWTPSGLVADADVAPLQRGRSSKTLDRAITLFLVVAVAYFAVDKFVIGGSAGTSNKSIAVLPLVNISNDPEQDFLGSGISISLTNLLASIPELRVISSDTFKSPGGRDMDIAGAAKSLDVTHVVVGAVQKAGDRIRVAVQLFDARENRLLWSNDYERTLEDIFAIQDDIAARVVGQLRLQLSAKPPTSEQIDPRAYELYLKGNHLSHAVRTPEAFAEAVVILEQVVEMEPAFVPGLWTLARSIVNAVDERDRASHQAADARIRVLVDRMVQLAPDSSYANGWLAFLAEMDGEDLQTVATYREKAVAGGNDTNVYMQQANAGRLLARIGRIDEATALLEFVAKRDPACSVCIYQIALSMRQAGRHREAAERLEGLLEWREPSPTILWSLGITWLVAGDPAKALSYFEQTTTGEGELGRVLALHDLGRDEEFEVEFSRMKAGSSANPEGIARIAAWTGQNDLAFEYLDRMVDQHGQSHAQYVDTDLYEPIKSDPRWQEFLKRNGVAKEDLSHIRFDPPLPPEVIAEIQRMRGERN